MDIFELAAKLTLDSGEYERGIEAAKSAAASFGQGLSAVVSAVTNTDKAVNNAADSAENLGNETANAADGVNELGDAEDNVAKSASDSADSIANAADAASDLADSAEASVQAVEESADSMEDAANSAEELGKSTDKAEDEMHDAEDALEDYAEEADDAADSTEKLGDEEEKTTKKTSTFKDTLKALLSRDAIEKGLGVLWNGVKQIGQAFVSVGKQAVEAYASYEQLTGGVETLFGNASAEIEKVGTKAISALSDDVWERLGEQLNDTAISLRIFGDDVGGSMDTIADAMTYGIGTAAEDMDGYIKYLQEQYGLNAKDAQEMADAVSVAIRSNIDDMGDYAKNMAGIKSAADIVKENAANAFKTAGMSANQYMETVTSFSASLLQSLGGDTVKAAELADVAITDMSDKMLVRLKRIEPYQGCGARKPQEMAA